MFYHLPCTSIADRISDVLFSDGLNLPVLIKHNLYDDNFTYKRVHLHGH